MRVLLITLRYSNTLGGFDQRPIQEATCGRELIAFREHFFLINEIPHLVCVLTCQDPVVAPPLQTAAADDKKRRGRTSPDPLAELDEAQRLAYSALREWRGEKSRAEGLPAYVLFTNRELAAIVRAAPESRTALGHVTGVGTAKVEKHGEPVLRILRECRLRTGSTGSTASTHPPDSPTPTPTPTPTPPEPEPAPEPVS